MKKLLAATTALVLASGAAYAEITVGGDARMGLKHDSSKEMDFNAEHRFRVKFGASGTTDNGLSFGAGVNAESTHAESGRKVGEATVSISGGFGTITFGNNDEADLLAGDVADLGYDGVGVDDIAEDGGGRGGTKHDIRYDQSIGGVAVAMSFGPNDDNDIDYALGMSFSTNGIRIGAGFDSNDGMALGVGYALNDELSLNGWYGEENDMDGMGGDLTYGLGATALTVAFATNSADEKAAGLGLSHNLGGGAKLVAGFGQMDGDDEKSVAEVGFTFDF